MKNKEFYYGIGVEEEFAGVLDIKESEYVHYYPEQFMSLYVRSFSFESKY